MNNNFHKYRKDMRALIDWLQFTLPRSSELSKELLDDQLFWVFDLLRIPQTEFKLCKTGMHGYKKRMRYHNITILWDGAPDMGVHVIFTGQGCRAYEQYMMMLDDEKKLTPVQIWGDLINRILEYTEKFTRLDGAIDDFKTHFKLSDLDRKIDDGLCSSKFTTVKTIKSRNISTGEVNGITIYMGSDKSDFQLVCYDKYLERKKKGKELEDGISSWNRFECRFKNDHATKVAKEIAKQADLGKLLHGVIHRYFNVLQPKKNDSNRSRWDYWRPWARFIGGVEKVKLEIVKPDKTIEDTIKFAKEKLPRVLAKVHAYDERLIDHIVADGIGKLTDQDLEDLLETKKKQKWFEMMRQSNISNEYEDEDDQIYSEFAREMVSEIKKESTHE